MLFGFFRVIIVFYTVLCAILSIFAISGAYKNASYLNKTYLIDFQLMQLNLSSALVASSFAGSSSKRELVPFTPIDIFEKRAAASSTGWVAQTATSTSSGSSSTASSVSAATADGYLTTVQEVVEDIQSRFTYADLGLADVYTVSYWGYCRGQVTATEISDVKTGDSFIPFDNSKVNITWCSKAVFAYKFDPLALIKHELNNTVNGISDGPNITPSLTTAAKSELKVLLDNISYDNFYLPGSIEKNLTSWQTVSKASFIILLVVIIMSAISSLIQILAFCFSPNHCVLSFLNFLFLFATFVLSFVTAAMATALFLIIRNQVNSNTDKFGVKSYVSINFYAFIWSAIVAGGAAVVMHLLGHCVGMFSSGRKRYRHVGHHHHDNASVAYEHDKENDSD